MTSRCDMELKRRRPWQPPQLGVADVKQITASRTGSGTDRAAMRRGSDRRLKRDIVRLATSPSGIPLYRFRYVDDEAIHVGAMAQDLLASHPDAVELGSDGHYIVDYARIDALFGKLTV